MLTCDVARVLGLSRGRVRALTKFALPRPLPCVWDLGRRRLFDPALVDAWQAERLEYFGGHPRHWATTHSQFSSDRKAKRTVVLRKKLAEKYGNRLGITEALLDRWAARGWG